MSCWRNWPPWCRPPGRVLPPLLIHLIRYHGVLAPNAADRARIVPGPETTEGAAASSSPVAPGGPVQRLAWAQLLARVWDLDVTVCPRCGGRMQWVASGESRRDSSSLPLTDPGSVRTYLTGVGRPAQPPVIAPARPPPQPELEFAA